MSQPRKTGPRKVCPTCNRRRTLTMFEEGSLACTRCLDAVAAENNRERALTSATGQYRARLEVLCRGYKDMTPERYERMRQEQGNACAICLRTPTKGLFIDHCHTTNDVRGLLCPACNSALGMFADNIESMERAIAYLRRSRETVRRETAGQPTNL